ncbi:tyrosine-protein phosphatase non-receptor type 21, partial [Austrofundulus limnaeus]|uniref:Tyrosine-protein phosphatase non-receptor type 21 n=1 Tax=Austrofundulus limnaeus TaxID=52670 RepID=A0A2I4C8T5_AUSLI
MKKGLWKTVAHLKRLSVSRRSVVKDEPKQTCKDEKCKWLEEHMENSEFYKEYESIPMCRRGSECTVIGYTKYVDKNRFQDVVPYDDTRVKLVPTEENSMGYINASHIRRLQ